MPLISFAALLFLGHLLAAVLAQGSSCSRELLGQGCDLAESYRRSPRCPRGNPTGAQRPLNDPPTSEYANNCMCTTSYYSLVSACELCKGSRAVTWHVWKQNCRDFAINGPDNYGLDYPSWAQLSYGDQETFNVERLRQEGRLTEPQPQPQPQPQPTRPEPTTTQPPANPTTRTTRNGSPSQTTTSAPTVAPTASTNSDSSSSVESSALSDSQSISGEDASTSLSGSGSRSTSSPIIQQELRSSANPNNPNVPNPSDDPFGLGPAGTRGAGNNDPSLDNATGATGKSPNVGAIVGGVVGGLFLVLLIAACLYFFVLRRRRNRIPASAAYMAQFGDSRVTSFRSQPLHSSSNSIENARPESPTLPRSSVDLYNPYYDSSPVASTHPNPAEDPFNPPPHSSPPENYADMRETNNMSRQSSRRYTRTPTPLVGPRPR